MNPFAGKTPTERNKMIAAIVLGVVSLFALYMAFGRGMFSGGTTVAVTTQPTPRPTSPAVRDRDDLRMPTRDQQDFAYATTEIVYSGGIYRAPDPGRNIFAFYEPPPPCPSCTPSPTPEIIRTPPPTPPPPMMLTFVMPQTIYAGSAAFRLEVNGDKFDPLSRIYFRQSELPTRFLSPQKLVADVPSTLVAGEGPAQVIVQTPDGKLYSNQMILNIQEPPKPQFQYTGAKLSARGNNDTAYFTEQGKQLPIAARLNDVVAGRFRLISISAAETVFEDVNLGFKHRVQLHRPPPGSTSSSAPDPRGRPMRGGFPSGGNYVPYNPNMPNPNVQPQEIPGIPSNVPRYQPPANVQQRPPDKKAEDDADDDGDG